MPALDQRIDERVRAIGQEHAWWPCRRGCDACCRSLGDVPHATRAEWERLDAGIRILEPKLREAVEARIAALDVAITRPVVCPFLELQQGACLVYEHRLLACRAFGYYVSRGEGRWCAKIDAELAVRQATVMLGNQDALMNEARMAGGESMTLLEWWRQRR